MMQRYRFIGSFTEMSDRTFSRFGQIADWDETYYRDVVMAGPGAPFIPEVEFKKISFSQEEFDRYADVANRSLAPDSFQAKVKQCILIWHDIHQRLKTRGAQEEIASLPEKSDEPLATVVPAAAAVVRKH